MNIQDPRFRRKPFLQLVPRSPLVSPGLVVSPVSPVLPTPVYVTEAVGEVPARTPSAGQTQGHVAPDFSVNRQRKAIAGQPGRFYSYQVAEMPFLAKSSEALSAAYWRVQEKLLSNTGEYTGAKLLTVFTTSAFQIHTTRVPIRRLSDFKGLKIRVSGGVQLDIADRLGIVPVLQPITQAYELLSGGVADGIGGPTQLLRDFKLTSVVRHTTVFPQGMNFSTFFFAMNQASFNALSQADRDAIMAVSGEALARIAGRNFDVADEETLAQMKASPAGIETASPELIRDFRAAVQPVEAKWIQDVKVKGLDGQALLAALRAEIRTLEK